MTLTYANICMLLVGFNLLQPFQVCVVGSLFAVRRFGGDPQKTSLFAGRNTQANLICVFSGGLLTVAVLALPVKYLQHYFSIFAVWLSVLVNVVQFSVYAFSKNKNHVKIYFWGFALAGVSTSFVQCTVTKVEGDSVHFYTTGLASIGLFVFVFHGMLKAIFVQLRKNIDYWILTCHLAFNVLFSLLTAVCWTVLVVPKIGDPVASALTGDGPTLKEALFGASIHIFFCFFGHFVLLFHYPMIAPYHLCPLESCHTILIVCVALEAVIGLGVGFLTDKYSGVPWVGEKAWWHLLWLIAVPPCLLWAAFLYALHYPESKLKKKMKESGLIGGLVTCIFSACAQAIQNFSMANSFGNTTCLGTSGKDGFTWSGHVVSFTIFVAIFGLATGVMLGEAHLRLYVEHERDAKAPQDWPTYGYSTGRAIGYWVWETFKKVTMSIPTLFTLDVVTLIQY